MAHEVKTFEEVFQTPVRLKTLKPGARFFIAVFSQNAAPTLQEFVVDNYRSEWMMPVRKAGEQEVQRISYEHFVYPVKS